MSEPFLNDKAAGSNWLVLLVVWVLAIGAGVAPAQTNLPTLTTAQEIHELTPEAARLEYPVRLRGVVTFYDLELDEELFIQDETGGIFIEITKSAQHHLQVGQLIEIEGRSAPGGFAPDVKAQRVRQLGQAPLPPVRRVGFGQIAAGQEDCNWVECGGIVHGVITERFDGLLGLEMVMEGGRVLALIQDFDLEGCKRLVDARISVRGVCVTKFNKKRQLLQAAVQVSKMSDVVVEKPAPADPFAVTVRPINSLLQFAPEEEHGHRVKVRGVVTLQQHGRSLFIADETQGLYVQTKQTSPVQPGDMVEVLGFPASGEFFAPFLQDAVFRKLGSGPAPRAVRVTAQEARRGIHDATLVEIEGLVRNRVQGRSQILELQSSNLVFQAQLDLSGSRQDPLAAILDGSRVRLTGVCMVRADPDRIPEFAQSFSILLRSAADVRLLERPSWWTVQHTLWVLAATLAVFFASLGWVGVLRRQVKAQTEIIRQKAQREAALEERSRIARDLHDDLGASLTQIAFLSQVARKEEPCAAGVEEHLREISDSSQEAFQALDEIVWVVTPKNDTIEHLTNYICHFAESFFRGSATRCRLDPPTRLPERPIPTEMRNHLFYAVKEALNNIRKHAGASEATVRVRFEAPVFLIAIEDNGRGFNPVEVSRKGNGLLNLRQRLEKIGGQFLLNSAPGEGTRISLSVTLGGER